MSAERLNRFEVSEYFRDIWYEAVEQNLGKFRANLEVGQRPSKQQGLLLPITQGDRDLSLSQSCCAVCKISNRTAQHKTYLYQNQPSFHVCLKCLKKFST